MHTCLIANVVCLLVKKKSKQIMYNVEVVIYIASLLAY